MAVNGVKRKRENGPKRSKKQQRIDAYHSSSSSGEDSDAGIELPNLVDGRASKSTKVKPARDAPKEDSGESDGLNDEFSDEELDSDADADDIDDSAADVSSEEASDEEANENSIDSQPKNSKKRINKRDDPSTLATSISKILSSKLTTSNRADPVLSRSATAAEAASAVQDSKLERAAKRKLREEKHAKRERGHIKDVLALEGEDAETARVIEEERRLRKLAQRGVVRLFNAVRAAQVSGEAERDKARKGGDGRDRQKERVTEMSKKGFLDLLNAGG